MEERSLGMHLRDVSVGMRAHEGTGGLTGKSSCARSEVSTAARRAAALGRGARARARVKSTRVGNRYESGPRWAGGVSACWSGEEGKDIETFLSSSGLVLFIPLWEPSSHDELMVLMILYR